jgi:NitT/TauT family transport system substrate-binding protein
MKTTTFTVIALVMVAAAGILGGCTAAEKPAEPPKQVSIGISATSLLPALVHIADEKGYFLEQGLDVVIAGYPTGKAALTAALDGEVDVATVADTPIAFFGLERNDFSVFVTIVDSTQHAKALARKDRNITTPQDLIGKKVATTIGTTAHFFMATFFALNGIDASDVTVVDLRPGETVEAIMAGDVDAIFAWEPNVSRAAERLGDNALMLPSMVGYLSTFSLAAKNEFIESHPELLAGMIRALSEAEQFADRNRDESIDILASRLAADREAIDRLWDGYGFRLSLSQTLLTTLEDEARWAIRSGLSDRTEVPNYLGFIHLDALDEVRPEVISIIR